MRKIARCCVVALFGYLALLAAFPAPVHADGGAPNLAYVAGAGPGISIVDIAQKKVTGTFTLAGQPQSVFLSLDGRFLYVAQPDLDQVSVLAARDGQSVCTAHVPGHPSLLSYDLQTNTLFAAGNQAASVSALDLSNCAILHTLQTNNPVQGLAVMNLGSDTQDNQLWVANGSGVTVFDSKTDQVLANIPLPDNPRYLCAPPNGRWIYATTQQGSLYAIALDSHRVMQLLSGGQFGPMDFDETTGEIYVPDSLHQQLDKIRPPDQTATTPPREPVHIYPLNDAPQSVAITSNGLFGFVALAAGKVAMLDIPGRQVLQTIEVGGEPRFIITGLYPPALGNTPQQATLISTISTIAAYILLAALVLVPVWFAFKRHRKPEKHRLNGHLPARK